MWILVGKFRGRELGVSSSDGNERTANELPIPCLIGMVKTKLCPGEGEGEFSPSPLPIPKKIDQEGLAQKIKTKNPKFMSVCEMRAYTLRCNVALLQATYPSRSQAK